MANTSSALPLGWSDDGGTTTNALPVLVKARNVYGGVSRPSNTTVQVMPPPLSEAVKLVANQTGAITSLLKGGSDEDIKAAAVTCTSGASILK